MGLAGTQLIANLHDEYGFMLLDDGIFSFLGGQVGIFILQLLRGDKGYLAAQLSCDAGVFFLYDFECITDCKNDALHSEFQLFDISLFGSDNSFPIPRFHKGEFYIYWGDPDYGIYMIKTRDPKGSWSKPVLVKAGKGMIDPTPLWDEDGKVYLIHAYAGSRSGVNSILVICELNAEGTEVISDPVLVFDGNDGKNQK